MSRRPSILLTDEELTLIQRTIVAFEINTDIGRLLTRATVVPGGRRLSGTDEELDELLGAVWVEIRGFHRVAEENAGREIDHLVPGSTAAQLATIYDKIEQYLS